MDFERVSVSSIHRGSGVVQAVKRRLKTERERRNSGVTAPVRGDSRRNLLEGKEHDYAFTEGKIIDRWSTLMEQCQGEGEGLLQTVETNLERHQAPGVTWKRESVASGWLKGLLGKRRDYLLLTHERFDDYLMCVGARDYGSNRDVSWYLTGSTKSALVRALGSVPGVGVAAGLYAAWGSLDVFDQQDLTAYVTVGHHAVLRAVEELMQQKKLDVARLERKSRGGVA